MARKSIDVTVKAAVEIPRVPNFIKQKNGDWLPLCAFDQAGIEELGVAFTKAMLARAAEQNKDPEFFYKNANKGEA